MTGRERSCYKEEEVNNRNDTRRKTEVSEQAVESEGKIGVVVRRVVVGAFLEGILVGVAVKTDGPVRHDVKMPVRGHVPEEQSEAENKQNRSGFSDGIRHLRSDLRSRGGER